VAGEASRAGTERNQTGGESVRAGGKTARAGGQTARASGEVTRADGTAPRGSPGSETCEYSDPDDEASPPWTGVRVSSTSGVAGMTARVYGLPRVEQAGLPREGGLGVLDPLLLLETVWMRGGKGFGVFVPELFDAGAVIGFVGVIREFGVAAGVA